MAGGSGSTRLKLRDGTRVLVRPIEPGDKQALLRAFERLSEESRYRRFASPMPKLSARQLAYLTEVDHRDHEALVAFDPRTGEGVGTARYVRSPTEPDLAEAAVTVVDDWQGRGLGGALLEQLADRARDRGIRCFTAVVQRDNLQAIRMLDGLGEAVRSPLGPQVELRIELPEEGVGVELRDVLRAAAAGSLAVAGTLVHRTVAPARRARPRRRGPSSHRIDVVVAGTDGSETARQCVRGAIELSGAFGSALHLVSAYNPRAPRALRETRDWVPDGLSDLSWVVAGRGDAEAALADAVGAAQAAQLTPRSHPREGDPADALLAVADEQRADLIVVGSKGMRGTGRRLLGSVAAKVIRHAPCNVLIVRTTASRADDPRRRP